MPRDIPLGNGKLLVCFDKDYCIRDLYFPHVGQENHLNGNHCRFGVWADGEFSWVESAWAPDLKYAGATLVTRVVLSHERLGLRINCRDAVDFHENLYLRDIDVENLRPEPREIRLFFTHAFSILGNSVGDTAAHDPTTGGIIHYKDARYFLANAGTVDSPKPAQFAVGVVGMNGREGTFRDAEDGILSGNSIAQGSVDSVIAVHLKIGPDSGAKASYWMAAGQNWAEIRRLNDLVRHKGVENLIDRTSYYWRLWAEKETPPLEHLPEKVRDLYRRSLLVMGTQIDSEGGITAANDTDVVQFNRDTYSYVWPRDGALAANALDEAGYPLLAQNFYRFIAGRIESNGYFLHKYNPDGTLASSWHPWSLGGQLQLPIQEDETALVIWALWNHFVRYRDLEFIKPFYRPLIKNAAEFMVHYRDVETALPDASYDLWEEQRGIFSFTVGTVFGGLTAASLFCTVFGENEQAERYRRAASQIRDAASSHLWRPELNRFCRGLRRDGGGKLKPDPTLDASLWGLSAFGLYAADDPRIQSTMSALKEKLWVPTAVGGMARYENDSYHRVTDQVVGNPWFICTLWYADYLTEIACDEAGINEALKILEWVSEHALPSGVLPEQADPLTGHPLSVSPLTWSHAGFVSSTRRILNRLAEMKICPSCGVSAMPNVLKEHWMEKLFKQTCGTIRNMCGVK